MKKIVNGNSSCENCINSNAEVCRAFINKQVLNGLQHCADNAELNYIYEKETKMKLTKSQKQVLKNGIQNIKDMNGFIHIYANGITQVFIPASNAPDNRMFKYGQSVCNKTDKYKRKLGIYLAIMDYGLSNKLMPLDLISILEDYTFDFSE